MLTIKDAVGTQVYSANVNTNGSFQSSPAGTMGAWTIVVTLTNVNGTLNFRVQKG